MTTPIFGQSARRVARNLSERGTKLKSKNFFLQNQLERLERRDLPAQAVLGSLLLDSSSLVLNGSTYTASGPVDIGYNPTGSESYVPLTIWNGNMSFTSGGSSFDFSGTIQGIEQSSNLSLIHI